MGKHEFIGTMGKCHVCGIEVTRRLKFCRECRRKRMRVQSVESHVRKHGSVGNYYKEWYKSNGRKRDGKYIKIIKDWAITNPEKVKASKLVGYAVSCGKIYKPSKCEICGESGYIVGHHEDYNKPFDVMWLCQSCHKKKHNRQKITNMEEK